MNSCVKPSEYFILFDDVILHICILFILLLGLLKFIIAPVTEHHINNQFMSVINNANVKISPETKESINLFLYNSTKTTPENASQFLNKISHDYLNAPEDPLVSATNNAVYEGLVIVVFFMVFISVIINFLFYKTEYCNIIKNLGIKLLILFSCVGAIEYWFFKNVATKFIPVNPDILLSAFKTKINKL
jgi:hypothetical protein